MILSYGAEKKIKTKQSQRLLDRIKSEKEKSQMLTMFICEFLCEDKSFFWGPFRTKKEAKEYIEEAKEQSIKYYGRDIANERLIHELTLPVKFNLTNDQIL